MDWQSCCKKRIAKKVHVDLDLISSLKKSSENKRASQEKLPMDTTTAASKVTLAYDSLRETLEALALKKGYKVYNHECYTAFLKEVLEESTLGDDFDEVRKVRNAVNYYGKELSVWEAEDIIKNIIALRTKMMGALSQL
jgi:uncharacterized protein (UPF0332 family)